MIEYEPLLELLRSRRSIRRFANRPVSRDRLSQIVEAARWAPSNHNRQPWKFLVLDDRERIRGLAERVAAGLAGKLNSLPMLAAAYAGELAHYATLFREAPVVILALHKRPVSVAAALLAGVSNPALVSGEPLSVAMAVQNLLLAAHALGLGACVMTAPLLAPEALGAAVALPAGFEATCFVAVGHPAESPEPPRKKTLEQIIQFVQAADRTHQERP